MSKPLWEREMHRLHEERMRQVIGWLEDPSAVAASPHHLIGNTLKVARHLKRIIHRYKNPSLIHNGGKS